MIDCKKCKHSDLLYREIVGLKAEFTGGSRLFNPTGYILCSRRHKKRSLRVMTDYKLSCRGFEEKEEGE